MAALRLLRTLGAKAASWISLFDSEIGMRLRQKLFPAILRGKAERYRYLVFRIPLDEPHTRV